MEAGYFPRGNTEKKEDPNNVLHLRKQRRLNGADVIMLPILQCPIDPEAEPAALVLTEVRTFEIQRAPSYHETRQDVPVVFSAIQILRGRSRHSRTRGTHSRAAATKIKSLTQRPQRFKAEAGEGTVVMSRLVSQLRDLSFDLSVLCVKLLISVAAMLLQVPRGRVCFSVSASQGSLLAPQVGMSYKG
jgi:hypothetical protein